MDWATFKRELWFVVRPYSRVAFVLLWFYVWFGLLNVRGWLVVAVLFFNPYFFIGAYNMWVNRDSLVLSYEYMKGFWRERREKKKERE